MCNISETFLLIILSICFIALSTCFCGCVEEEKDESNDDGPNYPHPEYGWMIEVYKISGTYDLDDILFEVSKGSDEIFFTHIAKVNPEPFYKGSSTVYAISCNSSPIVDESTGEIVSGASALSDYKNCSIAYIDQTSNCRIDGGDCIYVYSDWERDGKDEVNSGTIFTIFNKNNEIIFQKELER
jgi:hypothetical protein